MTRTHKRHQQGFTIVELLIATAILSTILVAVTIVMINISNLYYKGVNQALVQSTARSIEDEISQRLELSSLPKVLTATGLTGTKAYCIDNTRYTYVIGVQIDHSPPPGGGTVLKHVLWRDTIHSADACNVANLAASNPSLGSDAGGADASDGTELMAPRSRLISFSINPHTSPYKLKVGVAYGDDDLLCSPSVPNSCNIEDKMGTLPDYLHGDLHCKGVKGQQFCSTSNLSTTVVQRLTLD
jgi:prepilin-type N-terminal cleavage/methylation domain-containing protein